MKPCIPVLLLCVFFAGCSAKQIESVVQKDDDTQIQPGADFAIVRNSQPESKELVTEAQIKRLNEHLLELAKKAEVDANASREKLMTEAQAEHDADVAAYQFKASRWGDWLEVSIGRKTKSEKLEKFSTSINLKLVTTVRLEAGHAPDSEGTLFYLANLEADKKSLPEAGGSGTIAFISAVSSCGSYELRPAPKGYHYVVAPDFPTAPYRELFKDLPRDGMLWGNGTQFMCGYMGVHHTEHFVRFADDDQIHFDGIATMYTPAGLGEKVYREILAAKDSGR